MPLIPASSSSPKGKPRRKQAYLQALAMQQAILETAALCQADAASCEDRELRARIGSAIAAMARGWDILEDRKRVLRGKPTPGHLRPDAMPKRKPNRNVFTIATLDQVTAIPAKEAL